MYREVKVRQKGLAAKYLFKNLQKCHFLFWRKRCLGNKISGNCLPMGISSGFPNFGSLAISQNSPSSSPMQNNIGKDGFFQR